jgi:hypothetical protein
VGVVGRWVVVGDEVVIGALAVGRGELPLLESSCMVESMSSEKVDFGIF